MGIAMTTCVRFFAFTAFSNGGITSSQAHPDVGSFVEEALGTMNSLQSEIQDSCLFSAR